MPYLKAEAQAPLINRIVDNGWYLLMGIVALGVLIFVIYILILLIRRRNRLYRSLNTITLEITMPKYYKEKLGHFGTAKKEEKELIALAEQMYANMSGIAVEGRGPASIFRGKPHITLEIVGVGGEVRFFVACQRRIKDFVIKHIQSVYPRSQVEESGEYNIFRPGYSVRGTTLKLARKDYFSLRTYKTIEGDPLNSISNTLGKIGEDEGAAVQIMIKPAKKTWGKEGSKVARKMEQGRSYQQVAGMGKAVGAYKEATRLMKDDKSKMNQDQGRYNEEQMKLTPMQQEVLKGIEEKANKVGFNSIIRIMTSAQNQQKADLLLNEIVGSFEQFNAPEMNQLIRRPTRIHWLINKFIFRFFNWRKKSILATEELASIYHFPTRYSETPNIRLLLSKKAAAPANIPSEGLFIGDNVYRGIRTPINMIEEDRMRHMYIIGRTGTGKSTILENLVIQDIRAGKGVCVVDPHGDLVENILLSVPKERADDVVYFSPGDTERPIGLNMLEYYNEEQKDFVVQEMIAIFYKLFPPEMIGPMFEHNMRNVMLTLMADKEKTGTITEIPRMFTDKEFQDYKVAKVTDPVVRSFWEKEMAKTSDFHKSEMLGYLISKVGRFVENEMIRNIIGQSKSGFNLRDIMDNEKILLVNLSKGKLGEVNSDLLGLVIVSKIQMAAMGRADIPHDQRKDFFLYIDEFQNYTTDSIATVLSEARKYRLALIMAHQYIGQLVRENQDTKIKDAVFGNVGSIFCYRIGVEDSETMAKVFEPVFEESDVMNIEKFNMYAKMMFRGQMSKPFNIEVPPPLSMTGGNRELAEAIKQLSRLKYGRDKAVVEAEIEERSRLGVGSPAEQQIGQEVNM